MNINTSDCPSIIKGRVGIGTEGCSTRHLHTCCLVQCKHFVILNKGHLAGSSARAVPMGPCVSSRIQSSPLDSQVGRFISLFYDPSLLIGKSCLASSHQLCWDLDRKFSTSPRGILLWLSCGLRCRVPTGLPSLTLQGRLKDTGGPAPRGLLGEYSGRGLLLLFKLKVIARYIRKKQCKGKS